MKILIFLFLTSTLSAQLYPLKKKGDIFNYRPSKPLENLDNTGLVVVKRTMYGLYFEDMNIPDSTKKRIKDFFQQQNKGYTDFKVYRLNIHRKGSKWFIENHEL